VKQASLSAPEFEGIAMISTHGFNQSNTRREKKKAAYSVISKPDCQVRFLFLESDLFCFKNVRGCQEAMGHFWLHKKAPKLYLD